MDIITNSTIVVNYSNTKFGCSRACKYCNWYKSPFLPNHTYDWDLMDRFIKNTQKSFVTISGGGDPLFNIDTEPDNLFTLIKILKLIKSSGKNTRIITREINKIHLIPAELIDYISLSVDQQVLKELTEIILPEKIIYELTVVAPPNGDEKSLEQFLASVVNLKNVYNLPVTVRQNINNLIDPKKDKLLFLALSKNIKVVTSDLCLNKSIYFINDTLYTGYATTPNFREEILNFTLLNPSSILFGSIVRNYVKGNRFPYFKDIDIAIDRNTFVLPNNYHILRTEEFEGRTILLCQNIQFKEILFHVILTESPQKFVSSFQINLDNYGLKNINNELIVFNIINNYEAYLEYTSLLDSNQLIMSKKWANAPSFNKHFNKLISYGYEILDNISQLDLLPVDEVNNTKSLTNHWANYSETMLKLNKKSALIKCQKKTAKLPN